MMQKNNHSPSFSDLAIGRRKIKAVFFDQMNLLLDWNKIEQIISKYYVRGESAVGRPSYSGLLLFKMSLLQTWLKKFRLQFCNGLVPPLSKQKEIAEHRTNIRNQAQDLKDKTKDLLAKASKEIEEILLN
jgi:hypothetical protein